MITINNNVDYEVKSLDVNANVQEKKQPGIVYLIVGILFGILLVKSEVVSWFRIQEMFRFQSFHMYGVIGSAVAVGVLSVWIIKKFNVKTIQGEEVTFSKRKFSNGNIFGGLLFGCGWALTGACPGPLFAQIGTGAFAVGVTLLSAIIGTWVYGLIRERLPH
ncbi:transporter [Pseudochryseolinea flava]|uniref:Transporter n=2 Tax=Pseudochryseolinea flava TaxID=2059302 RepID=A0A364Y500_9BACT|nr:transporter [Pseudochryseolinea flava]